MNTDFCFQHYIFTVDLLITSHSHNIIEIDQCSCNRLITNYYVTLFKINDDINCLYNSRENSIVQVKNCHFTDMICNKGCTLFQISSSFMTINIIDCNFVNLNNIVILYSDVYQKEFQSILIRNTLFMSIFSWKPLARLTKFLLLFEGLVLFKRVNVTKNVPLFNVYRVGIHIYNYVEISNCCAESFVSNNAMYFALTQPATVNFTSNTVVSFTGTKHKKQSPYACTFQFSSNYNLDFEFKANIKLNFSIVFNANQWVSPLNSNNLKINHCVWLPGSAFNVTRPSDVNHRMITLINESFVTINKSLCYCSNQEQIDCQVDELGLIYPGQTLNIMLAYPNAYQPTPLFLDVYDTEMPPTACKVSFLQDANQIVGQTCTHLNFTITQINDYYKWCELNFKLPFSADDGYYITFYHCPAGFIKLNGKCQCDPILKSTILSMIIDDCDINDQTIKRPANSWISAVTNNNSHTYFISLDCPFDYCLPYSSRLKLLSSSDSQCQHKRSNLLCGQCLDGLSTVFGSSHCQKCSNANLFIIPPIALSGILLVVLLFILNLTVVDGTINAFILYVNIVSINNTVIFTSHDTATKIAYTFISLANLDMGIEVCFYNGMDDYVKMWLQLMYPFYLVLIAAVLIIASRYSTKIQRLTARRALPVLATLFLLSYTKILRTVSSVLFSYSPIVQLPSNHSTLMWSVDANVNILGIKFIALFIVCLFLFFLLIPFNFTLLFTRILSRFRIVNYFKPLLDVYQAPYKDKFYYWTGLHLVIKAVFFGISALDNSINFTISIILLCAIKGFVGYSCPFKNKLKNFQEMILLLNLHTLFVFTLSGQHVIAINIMIALAAAHFSFIVLYHVFLYTCGATFKSKVHLFMSLLFKKMTKKLSRTKSSRNNGFTPYSSEIPEITYNYSRYQESLLEEDYS